MKLKNSDICPFPPHIYVQIELQIVVWMFSGVFLHESKNIEQHGRLKLAYFLPSSFANDTFHKDESFFPKKNKIFINFWQFFFQFQFFSNFNFFSNSADSPQIRQKNSMKFYRFMHFLQQIRYVQRFLN